MCARLHKRKKNQTTKKANCKPDNFVSRSLVCHLVLLVPICFLPCDNGCWSRLSLCSQCTGIWVRSGQSLTLILPTPYTLKTSAGSCWLFCQFVLFETSMLQFINHIITHNAVIWYRTLLKNRRKLFLDKPPVTVAAVQLPSPPLHTQNTVFKYKLSVYTCSTLTGHNTP